MDGGTGKLQMTAQLMPKINYLRTSWSTNGGDGKRTTYNFNEALRDNKEMHKAAMMQKELPKGFSRTRPNATVE